ncbi:hypothetical protein BS78_K120500 [Paspalum vaginatum]|uniref:Uncharacterized protein n=1 Tax=Paspalum vaginatum TaxID=158149 RepID=A0A9W7X8L0_9POAL|nr:hypothetical protein BS78_K120500 [Paspalum vaginatum]
MRAPFAFPTHRLLQFSVATVAVALSPPPLTAAAAPPPSLPPRSLCSMRPHRTCRSSLSRCASSNASPAAAARLPRLPPRQPRLLPAPPPPRRAVEASSGGILAMAVGTTRLPEPRPLRPTSPSADRPLQPRIGSSPWRPPCPTSPSGGRRAPPALWPDLGHHTFRILLPSEWPADLVLFMISVVPHSLPPLLSFRSVAHRLPFQRRRSGTPHAEAPCSEPLLDRRHRCPARGSGGHGPWPCSKSIREFNSFGTSSSVACSQALDPPPPMLAVIVLATLEAVCTPIDVIYTVDIVFSLSEDLARIKVVLDRKPETLQVLFVKYLRSICFIVEEDGLGGHTPGEFDKEPMDDDDLLVHDRKKFRYCCFWTSATLNQSQQPNSQQQRQTQADATEFSHVPFAPSCAQPAQDATAVPVRTHGQVESVVQKYYAGAALARPHT